MLTASYIRGTNDARRYAVVEQTEVGWMARLPGTADPVWIIEPVDRDYLRGLYDAGCKVRTLGPELSEPSAMDRLLERVAWLMGAA
jgi:hypothetical protein